MKMFAIVMPTIHQKNMVTKRRNSLCKICKANITYTLTMMMMMMAIGSSCNFVCFIVNIKKHSTFLFMISTKKYRKKVLKNKTNMVVDKFKTFSLHVNISIWFSFKNAVNFGWQILLVLAMIHTFNLTLKLHEYTLTLLFEMRCST